LYICGVAWASDSHKQDGHRRGTDCPFERAVAAALVDRRQIWDSVELGLRTTWKLANMG